MRTAEFSRLPLYLALLSSPAALAAAPESAPAAGEESPEAMEEVYIVGVRDNRSSSGATGLNLDLKNTPQSISVIDRDLMNSFGASDINAALDLATGVKVERWETNRTNYVSRGFTIQNTQIDGVGLPNNWGLVTGAIDTYGYEKIEVIRGANGLLTGVGNASGTINYVRKRPTNESTGEVGVRYGSYGEKRIEADYSTQLTASGDWAARVAVAAEDKGSYLRDLENDRTFLYGVVDGQLTENSTLTFGASYQDANTDGNMWGALVYVEDDGTQVEWDEGTSTAQNWSYWDTINQTAFVEYAYRLPGDWELKASYNYRAFEDESQLLFLYVYPDQATFEGIWDLETGAGVYGSATRWLTDSEQHLLDINLSGEFELLGSTHQALFGLSHSESEQVDHNHPNMVVDASIYALPSQSEFTGKEVPEPEWGPEQYYSTGEQELQRAYGAVRLSFGNFTIIPGFNAVEFERDSTLNGPSDLSEVSPYLGVTYALNDNISLYGNYSDIFQTQDQYDINNDFLEPTQGVNYELGAKAGWFDGALLTSLAVFKSEQQDLSAYAGTHAETLQYYYEGQDIYSEGYELEVSGSLTDNISLLLGYTELTELEDDTGADTYTWVPLKTVKMALNATLPNLPVSLGLGGQWQSETSNVQTYTEFPVEQDSYLLLNAYAKWDIDERSELQLNVDNLSDEKYISSLLYIGNYGAPRTASLTYRYAF